MLTKEAFNALLKILEEPPAHAIFILATTEPERMPATIISRTQRFDFKRILMSDIVSKLESIARSERIDVEPAALHMIAAVAEGSFRDAESVFSQIAAFRGPDETVTLDMVEMILGAMNFGKLRAIIEALSQARTADVLQLIQNAVADGYDAHELSRLLLGTLRKILMLKIAPELRTILAEEHTEEDLAALSEFAERFDTKRLARLVRALMQAHPLVKRSIIPILPIELAIIENNGPDA